MAINNKNTAQKKNGNTGAKTTPSVRNFPAEYRLLDTAECHIAYPDAKSEFISELSGHIAKWRGRPGADAPHFAKAYENVLYQLLTPDTED